MIAQSQRTEEVERTAVAGGMNGAPANFEYPSRWLRKRHGAMTRSQKTLGVGVCTSKSSEALPSACGAHEPHLVNSFGGQCNTLFAR